MEVILGGVLTCRYLLCVPPHVLFLCALDLFSYVHTSSWSLLCVSLLCVNLLCVSLMALLLDDSLCTLHRRSGGTAFLFDLEAHQLPSEG